ncbi:eukaryotic translation initiation factor 4E-1A [Exaiptasia diaphana]|uniref:Eukaryotic translation initiation factor 4E n=1 Tax=Exaiptasia diaphana TaxID=2652724 RepID=A0A913WQ88_EXADI|nr:eukaryotic translation initiation factor 4E-1A [Exaiptasia diaphana]KXJ18840.1 Eukaryotic translation initiation factor 4E [Exaiptasia diaphana]
MASGDESTAKEKKETKADEEVKDEKTENAVVAAPQKYSKHPLQNKWSFWFFKNDKTKSWTDNLRIVTSFDTVEDFWAVFNHIQSASKLSSGCDYSLFKDGIEPMWEDARNKNGGRWLLNTTKHQRAADLDRFWLETLLLLIGEAFQEYSDNVNGAVIQIRNKGDKLAIWTDNAKDQEGATRIGQIFKERVGLPPRVHIGYQAHNDTMSKTGSTTKSLFSL